MIVVGAPCAQMVLESCIASASRLSNSLEERTATQPPLLANLQFVIFDAALNFVFGAAALTLPHPLQSQALPGSTVAPLVRGSSANMGNP
jgi:hypothetical protein